VKQTQHPQWAPKLVPSRKEPQTEDPIAVVKSLEIIDTQHNKMKKKALR
jgi:hypothetical protein